jgi:hypothetical protein
MTGVRVRSGVPVVARRPPVGRVTYGNGTGEPDTSGPARGIKLIGSILAPTTFLTALLLYFGHQHAYWYFDYFGVNATTMGLTTQDYVIRSVDPLFTPVTTAAAVCLVGLWGYRLLRRWLSDAAWQRLLRTLRPATAVGGFVLVAVAVAGFVNPVGLRPYVGVPGLALAAGVPLLVAAMRMGRTATPSPTRPEPSTLAAAEWGAIFVLVGIGLFWAVTDYAKAVGTGRGLQQEQALPLMPDVTVYSEKGLGLSAPGVREVTCQGTEAAYGFRYDGLKLILESGNQYFFLPKDWNATGGVAFVVPRNDTVRLEYTAPGQERGGTC